MADNLAVLDGSGASKTLRTTDNAGVHTPHHIAQQLVASTATLANVSGSATSVAILASNTSRLSAVVVNDSAAILYLKYGATASATSFTYLLQPGDTWEMPYRYTGAIDGIWTSATGAARVTELT